MLLNNGEKQQIQSFCQANSNFNYNQDPLIFILINKFTKLAIK